MKWKDELYEDLKYEILDIISWGLEKEDGERINLSKLTYCIDIFFKKLLEKDDNV